MTNKPKKEKKEDYIISKCNAVDVLNQHINQEQKKWNSTTVDADNENQYKSLPWN